MRLFICCCLLLSGFSANAVEIAGVAIEENLHTADGVQLHLNGAGVREKFFFDIYIAELYMENPSGSAIEVVQDAGHKRVIMHFLYDEVGKDKLIDGWQEGFHGNSKAEEVQKLQSRINQFNEMFEDVKKGENIVLDFVPSRGTTVTVVNQEKGVIPGKDFNDALLKIWLGDKPIDSDLKEKLLSYGK